MNKLLISIALLVVQQALIAQCDLGNDFEFKDNRSCTTPEGFVGANVIGGEGPYTYAWNTGDTERVARGLPGGNYIVTITDNEGCTLVDTFTLKDRPNNPNIELYSSNETTPGAGDGNVYMSGGGDSYLWSNGATTRELIGVGPDLYIVTVTNDGCTTVDSARVSDGTLCAKMALVFKRYPSLCTVDDGAAFVKVYGGTSPYNYRWSNGGTSDAIEGVGPGNYTVTVTDNEGCIEVGTVHVYTLEEPLDITLSATRESSSGANDGSATVVPSGVSPFMYNWSNGVNTATITGLAPGVYTVTVTDVNSCPAVDSILVKAANDCPEIDPGLSSLFVTACNPPDGQATASPVGGATPYTYLWSTGDTTSSISEIPEGSYGVTVTDANGCSGAGSVEVDNFVFPPYVIATSTNLSQAGADDGTASAEPYSDDPYTLLWSNGSSSDTITDLATGTYTVTITNTSGCSHVDSATIIVAGDCSNFEADEYVANITSCDSSNSLAAVDAYGGTAPYGYQWSTGDTTSFLFGVDAGDYTVTITDDAGCEISDTLTIVLETDEPTLLIGGTNEASMGANNGSATAFVGEEDIEGYSFLWSNGESTAFITGLGAGIYSVTVTDLNGCTTDAEIELFSADGGCPAIEVDLSGFENTSCTDFNGLAYAFTIGGADPLNFSWNTGDTTELIQNLPPGSYSVTITDANGCEVTDSILIPSTVAFPEFTISSTNESSPGAADGSASVTTTGSGSYTYLWNTGATTPAISDLAAGTYFVTVSLVNGCSLTDSVEVSTLVNTNNIESLEKINLYPNPSNGNITLDIKFDQAEQFTIEWYNSLGNKISYSEVDRTSVHTQQFDFKDRAPGVYLCRLKVQHQTITKRVIIQHSY